MVVSTIYDPDLKAKVFQVRGSERYTNSTITSCEVEYTANHRSYLSLDLSASVKNQLGASSVVFYDGNESIGVVGCSVTNNEVELEDVRVPYGYHKIYAKFIGNTECLSSKSGIIELNVPEAELPTPTLSLSNVQNEYATASNISINANLYSNGNLNGKTIKLYVNDELVNSFTTNSGGNATITAPSLEYGSYDALIIFEGDEEYTDASEEISFEIGCNVSTSAKYPKVAVGNKATFVVSVKSFADEPLENETLTLES